MINRSKLFALFFIALGTLVVLTTRHTVNAVEAPAAPAGDDIFKADARILFQGDSITDGNRGRSADPNHILGHGYQFIIACKYGERFAERHPTFMNRGISGNKVSDLAGRWKPDTIDLKPDVLSILIGINDMNAGVTPEQYETNYDKLLADTMKAMPDVKLVLCEPFGLPVGGFKDKWPEVRANLEKRQAIVEKLATKYHAALVHFQRAFDEALKRAPADYWIWDGVHPTYNGHQLMANEWERAVREMWPNGTK